MMKTHHALFRGHALAAPLVLATALAAQATTPPTIWQRYGSPDPSRQATLTFCSHLGVSVLFGGDDSGPLLDRTATFDGAVWRHLLPNGSPEPRTLHAAAYDPVRQRLVVFGGQTATQSETDETWEFDGTGWRLLSTGLGPIPRVEHALSYDFETGRVLLFGGFRGGVGYLNDTWSWNGATWTQEMPATVPGDRVRHAMAPRRAFFPGQRSHVVMFGGVGNATPPNQTWIWDGLDWALAAPPTSPPGRQDHAMVRDAQSNEVVLFGGLSGGIQVDDTWSWNGTTWTQVALGSPRPPIRQGHGLAFDDVRGRVVLHGGHAGGRYRDTWEFDGITWTEVPSSPERMGTAMAYDRAVGSPTRDQLIMFGGRSNGAHDDTWAFDGLRWTKLLPNSPLSALTPRGSHGMATTPSGSVLLFGGNDGFPRGDTYEWNGTTWTQLTPPTSPPARDRFAMVATATGPVIFGGNSGGGFLGSTWQFANGDWTLLTTTGGPPSARNDHAIAYDPARNVIVLFGGANSTGKLGDTWELDLASSTWTQFFPTQPPAARSNHSMAFDAGRGVVVLVGGDTANALALDEVWEWNGTTATWTRQDTRCLQQGRREAAMVSDPTRGVVLYGGQQANFGLLFDVWSPLTSSPASYSPIGMGCAPATAAVPSLTAVTLPWLDASFELRVSNAPAGGFVAPAVAILQAPTPIPLPFGPNCRSYLFGPFALPPIFASGAGVATITMNFPKKLNAFVGLNFYAQAAMLDSQTRVLLTNAGHAVLGRR